jgi:urease accessory protein
VRFEDDCLLVLLDGPLQDYRDRIQPLLDAGDMTEVSHV